MSTCHGRRPPPNSPYARVLEFCNKTCRRPHLHSPSDEFRSTTLLFFFLGSGESVICFDGVMDCLCFVVGSVDGVPLCFMPLALSLVPPFFLPLVPPLWSRARFARCSPSSRVLCDPSCVRGTIFTMVAAGILNSAHLAFCTAPFPSCTHSEA